MKLSITKKNVPDTYAIKFVGQYCGEIKWEEAVKEYQTALYLGTGVFCGWGATTPDSIQRALLKAYKELTQNRRTLAMMLAGAELDPLAGQPVQRLGRDPYEWQDKVAINIIHDHEPTDGVTPPSDDWHVHPDDETLPIDANETATEFADDGGVIPLMMVCRRMVGDTLPVEIICEYELVELHRLPSRVVAEYELLSID